MSLAADALQHQKTAFALGLIKRKKKATSSAVRAAGKATKWSDTPIGKHQEKIRSQAVRTNPGLAAYGF